MTNTDTNTSRSFSSTPALATHAQFSRLRNGLAARKGNPEAEAIRDSLNELFLSEKLTRATASLFIITLEAIPVNQSPAAANVYSGTCERCSHTVEAGAGLRRKSDTGKWVVSHLPGECPVIEFPFADGSYAIEVDGTLRFYSCHDGAVFARRSDDEVELTNLDNARAVVAQIALDPQGAAVRFGRAIGYCGYCGKSLTGKDGRSLAAGVGPRCAKKHDIPW